MCSIGNHFLVPRPAWSIIVWANGYYHVAGGRGRVSNGEYKYLPRKGTKFLTLGRGKYPLYKPCLGSGEDRSNWKWWDWSITFQIYSIEWIFSDLGLPDGKLISHEVPDGHDQNTLNHKYLNSWDNVGKGEQKKIVFVINAFAMARLVKTDAYLHAHQTASASDSLMVYTFATAGHNSFPGMVPNMGPLLNSLQILLDQI